MSDNVYVNDALERVANDMHPSRLLKLYGDESGFKIVGGVIRDVRTEYSKDLTNTEFIEEMSHFKVDNPFEDFKNRVIGKQTIYTGKELLEMDLPPLRYIVDGFMCEGTTILSGDPKVGKSLASLQLAACMASDGLLFNRFRCQSRGKVLHLCLEDGNRRLRHRMKQMGIDSTVAENIIPVFEVPRLGDGLEEWLDMMIAIHPGVSLVTIDPLEQIRPSITGRDRYKADYAAIQGVRRILNKHNVSGLIVHHNRKDKGENESALEKVSGTHGLTGAADHILVMGKVPGKKAATIHRITRDDDELSIGLELDGIRWVYAGSDVSVTLTEARRQIYECVAASPVPIGPTDIAREVGKSKGTVGEQCKAMVEEGQFEEFDGKYALAS